MTKKFSRKWMIYYYMTINTCGDNGREPSTPTVPAWIAVNRHKLAGWDRRELRPKVSRWKLPPSWQWWKLPREMPEGRDRAGGKQQANSTQASSQLLQLLILSIGSDDAYSGPDPMSQCRPGSRQFPHPTQACPDSRRPCRRAGLSGHNAAKSDAEGEPDPWDR